MPELPCPPDALHRAWDNSLPPCLTVDPGDTVVFTTADAADGGIPAPAWAPPSPASHERGRQPSSVPPGHPLCGPIALRGTQPGDTLAVEVLSIVPHAWGWTSVNAANGLLGAEITERRLLYWDLRGERALPRSADGPTSLAARVPIQPFCGVMGVALAASGEFSTIPPRAVGGNLDVRQLVRGSTLFLPVAVEGALFSVGDVHAAQGDGEVCGTGIECAATVTLRFTVRRGRQVIAPEYRTPAAPPPGERYGTTGVSPDLMEASRQAIRGMIAYLGDAHGLSPADAYILCSVAVDLAISEVVDPPNWVVSALLPLDVLTSPA